MCSLVEGTTEVAVMHGIADRENVGRLESLGVAVTEVGGKIYKNRKSATDM
ncbi:MAG: TOPRIM nucleotidyl transferase/hydrolase domain-containing protein [Microbacteriaceae bacterium]